MVDDEPNIIFTLKIILEENGFKVDSFTNPLLELEFKEQDGGALLHYDMFYYCVYNT